MKRRFLRKKDLLDMLGIGSTTFERWCNDKRLQLPIPIKIGGVRLWDAEEIENWIKTTKAAAVA